ncbi:MAG: SDR family oxidoreductase [Alphaproteobacteria bacterium]|nr:SDR family oxidoreductase [Alphaproteobacteria bacterium]
MDLQLAGKRVFITGASAGIGRAAAELFAGEGVMLALHGRREDALSDIASAIEAGGAARPHIVIGDLQDPAQCARIAEEASQKLGGVIDILFNNAGASMPMDDPSDEALWERSHQLNFAASRQITTVVIPDMKARQWGRIINVTGAMVAPTPNAAAPAKAALQSWSRGLAIQLAPFGITVNTIAPGRISTDQINNRLHPTAESRQAYIDRFIPAGYFGEPKDLAILAVFLASPLARYINGAAIPVDGAMLRVG